MSSFLPRSFLAAAAVAVTLASPALADAKGKLPWVEPAEGFQQAKLSGKPILLFFTADW